MLKIIREIKTGHENVAPFVSALTGQTVGFTYSAENYSVRLSLNRNTVEIPFPYVRETYSLPGVSSKGHLVASQGGTKRFIRPILRCKMCHPFLQYYPETPLHYMNPSKDYSGILLSEGEDEFYLSNFWLNVAEILALCIKNAPTEGRSVSVSFRRKFSEWLNKQELITNEWGPIIMGQEIVMGAPEISECSSSFTQEGHMALLEAFQLRAFQAGYALSATNKSDPGRVLTVRTDNTVCHRTELSRRLLPVSIQRACRAPREQRGLREAKKLYKPVPSSVHLEGKELSASLAAFVTQLPVLIADFPHTVPGVCDKGNWSPKCSMNKDRILLTSLGREMLITTQNVRKTFTEEQFAALQGKLLKKPDFKIVSDEMLEQGSFFVRSITVEYTDTETVVAHVKVVCPTGLKGVTEPIGTRFFASHKKDIYLSMLDEDSTPLKSMLAEGTLVEVAAGISASGIHSKRADAMIAHMILARMAVEDGVTRVIPDLKPNQWVSEERATSVDTVGYFEGEGDDYVEEMKRELASRGQDPEGLMYIYRTSGDQLIPVLDEEGGQFKGIFGYFPFWRTRHRDQIGSDVRTFGPNEDSTLRRRGVAVDSHVANLAGVEWPMNSAASERLSLLSRGMYLCGTITGFPSLKTSSSQADDYHYEDTNY